MATLKNKRAYRPRRRRSGTPPALQITPRDIDILRAVARHRFLNSAHICALIGGSPKNIRNRLKGLFELGLLDRPECQYDFYRPGGGSSLAVYALADAGARTLAATEGAMSGLEVAWSAKNRKVGRPFLEHTLAIADFTVALRISVADYSDVELLDGHELIARMPPETQAGAKPLRFSVPVIFRSVRHPIGVEPDYAFSLRFPQRKIRANYLVELDRGTMPIERSDLGASSILRKFLSYQQLWRTKAHTRQFGWRNFRVLLVTSDASRARHMRDCLKRHVGGEGSPLFWFADRTILQSADLFRAQWFDGHGRSRMLAPDSNDKSAS